MKNTCIAGIGIELGEILKGNLTLIDIDNCVNKKGEINKEAKEIIKFFNSFTEISVNGKGVHILIYGKKPANKCKINNLPFCSHLEIYQEKHYATLSGKVINQKNIEYRQQELGIFYKKYFSDAGLAEIEDLKIKSESFTFDKLQEYEQYFQNALLKDSKLKAYWDGERLSKDESSNDMGFCIKLSYWLNNEYLVKKYFIKSPYFSQKDDLHKAKCLIRQDYLDRTIAFALRRVLHECK